MCQIVLARPEPPKSKCRHVLLTAGITAEISRGRQEEPAKLLNTAKPVSRYRHSDGMSCLKTWHFDFFCLIFDFSLASTNGRENRSTFIAASLMKKIAEQIISTKSQKSRSKNNLKNANLFLYCRYLYLPKSFRKWNLPNLPIGLLF